MVAPENPPSPYSARRQNPALVALADDEGFVGFALRLRDIGQQPAEPRPTHRRAGEPAIIITLRQAHPTFCPWLAGLALHLQRTELPCSSPSSEDLRV